MTAAWPSDVNTYPQVPSYGEAPTDNIARFPPEVGPPKTRRRMSISSDILSIEIWMSAAEYASFLTFFRTTLKDGTLPFTFPHPRTLVTTTFVFASPHRLGAVNFQTFSVAMTIQSVP